MGWGVCVYSGDHGGGSMQKWREQICLEVGRGWAFIIIIIIIIDDIY